MTTEVAVRVTAESNMADVFSRDAQAVSASQEAVTSGSSKLAGQNKEAESSFEGLSSAAKSGQGALAAVSGEMGSVVSATGELVRGLVEDGVGLTGLAGAAAVSVGAFAELGTSAGALVNQISQVSAVTGLSVEQTDYWGNALSDVGGNVNSLVMVNRLLTTSLEGVATAQTNGTPMTQKESDLLKALGGSATNASGQVKTFADAFPQLIQNLSQVTNEQDRAVIGTEIFGRSWGQISMLVANYSEVSASATEQTAKNADAMAHAQEMATRYDTSMNDLKTTYDQVALKALPVFTALLRGADAFLEDPAWIHHEDVLSDLTFGYLHLHDATESYEQKLKDAGETEAADVPILANLQAQMAGNTQAALNYANSLDSLQQHLSGVAPGLNDQAAAEGRAKAQTIDSIRTTYEKKQADEDAYAAIAQQTDAISVGITAEHNAELASKAAAEAKKDETAANKDAALTVQGQVDLLYKQAEATNVSIDARRQYDAEIGVGTDLENNEIPTMALLVARHLDEIDAQKRDTEAMRDANAMRGIQVDINGQAIKSFQQMVDEQKASILSSQQMQKATDEANKELGIVSDTIKDTSSSVSSLTSSLNDATTAWHQMTDAESQSAAKARQQVDPNGTAAGNGGPGGTATAPGVAASSGGSVAFYSYGGGGGGAATSGTDVVPHAPSGPGTWIYNGAKGGWTSYSDPGQLNDPNLVYNSALGGYVSYSDPGTNPLQARASGGAVTSGQPYTVGERGPETFVPSQNGTILPNGSGAGGGNEVIEVHLHMPAGLDDYIVRTMRDSARRGGGYGMPYGAR